MKKFISFVSLIALMTLAVADNEVATLRGSAELLDSNNAPRLVNEINNDQRLTRDYPMAPPIIPHQISDYQIDLNVNKCLSCHNRQRVSDSQATMISVTHFMNREGEFIADVSTNRYFCTQCHVPQLDVKLLIENDFVSVDKLLRSSIEAR